MKKSYSQVFFMHMTQDAEVSWKSQAQMFLVFGRYFLSWEKAKTVYIGTLWLCVYTCGEWLFSWFILYNFFVSILHILPVLNAFIELINWFTSSKLLTCHRCCHTGNIHFKCIKPLYTFSSKFLILDFHFCFFCKDGFFLKFPQVIFST